MAQQRPQQTNFEDRFLDLLQQTISGIDARVEEQKVTLAKHMEQAAKTMDGLDKRLRMVEAKKPKQGLDISNIVSNKSLVYLVFACALVFLLILASALDVKVPAIGG